MFKNGMTLRQLTKQDIPKIESVFCFPWSTPEKTSKIWGTYYEEQLNGIRTVIIVEKNNQILGYGSFLRRSENSNFVEKNIPEINAIWIHEKFQRQGYDTALIKYAEDLAVKEGYQQIGIGVGLYRDYGPAQKLYFRLGYMPDGEGVTYKGKPTIPGESYPLDDEFIFWLIKNLKTTEDYV